MPALALTVRCMVAAVLFVAAAGKLRGRDRFGQFRSWFRDLPVPGSRLPGAAATAVAVEVAIGLGLLAPGRVASFFLLCAAALFFVFAAGTALILSRGGQVECRCFGAARGRLGPVHLVRDAALGAASVAGAIASVTHGAAVPGLPAVVAFVFLGLVLAAFVISFDNVMAVVRDPSRDTVA